MEIQWSTQASASATKLMGNGAQHGVAVGAAASLCIKYETSPRGLYNDYLAELKEQVGALTGCDHDISSTPPRRKFKAVPG